MGQGIIIVFLKLQHKFLWQVYGLTLYLLLYIECLRNIRELKIPIFYFLASNSSLI